MKIIDTEKWERKTQFLNFSKYTLPVFSVGVRLDVTDLVLYCQKKNLSFFSAFLYVVTKCSNEINEMKTRFKNNKVVQYYIVHPSYVVLRDDNCIATCLTEFNEDFNKFYQQTRKDIESVKKDKSIHEFNPSVKTDCLYISSLQWIDFSMVSNPYNFTDAEQTSIPRITWGKYVKTFDDKYEIGFNISAHHAFMDGWHIAQLIEKIESELKDIESFLR